jgi:arsenate reductase
MAEIGIDITPHRSKHVDEFAATPFDYVLTVCDHANESCPVFPAATHRLHHSFPDPAALQGPEPDRLAAFRQVRDLLLQYLRRFPV